MKGTHPCPCMPLKYASLLELYITEGAVNTWAQHASVIHTDIHISSCHSQLVDVGLHSHAPCLVSAPLKLRQYTNSKSCDDANNRQTDAAQVQAGHVLSRHILY